MNTIKATIQLVIYGDENRQYPDTYSQEQSYQCSRLLPLISLVSIFIWLSYVPLDIERYPNVEEIFYLRIGLSIVSSIAFGLYWIPFFRKNADYLISILGGYVVIVTSIITALTKGDPSYIGGYCMVLVSCVVFPIRMYVYYILIVFSVISFFVTLLLLDVNIVADVSKYSLNDLASATILAITFGFLLDRDRHSYYKKSKDRERQRIQIQEQAIKIQESNTILQLSEKELKQNVEELNATQEQLNKQKTNVQDAYNELQIAQKQISQANQELSSNFSILENKNQIIAQKNQDITSSINYAKRIQDAMLAKSRTISETVPNSFIYFQPRDIVSGDFYYFNKKNEKIVIAAVDCTGHGVPGAFMSLIGNNLLNQIIDNQKILDPAQILTSLDQLITEVLNQSYSMMRDGMDVAICIIDTSTNTLEYAGAKNPLIYIQNDELKIIKADRNSVGGNFGSKHKTTFTTHTLTITEPTHFYIYSDGYQDQFGGKDDKKYTTKRFLQTLQQTSTKEHILQREFLDEQFQEWKGKDNRQLDDVLVIGFDINPTQILCSE